MIIGETTVHLKDKKNGDTYVISILQIVVTHMTGKWN